MTNGKKSFTLIELVILILVLAIIAIFVSTQSTDLGPVRVMAASNKLKSDIRFAQNYALSSQKRARVSFDRALNRYNIYWEQSVGNWINIIDPTTKQNFTVNLNQGDYLGVTITSVDFGGADNSLVFNAGGVPYGYTSGGVSTVLTTNGTVVLSGTQTRTVTVIPQTGKVSEQ